MGGNCERKCLGKRLRDKKLKDGVPTPQRAKEEAALSRTQKVQRPWGLKTTAPTSDQFLPFWNTPIVPQAPTIFYLLDYLLTICQTDFSFNRPKGPRVVGPRSSFG